MTITSFRYTCSKYFQGYPCSHRQWQHPGHCRYVHGYSRSFKFWFAARELDEYGFVVDFSGLKSLEQRLREQFDHTFLVNVDDPLLKDWEALALKGALDLRVMKNVGMEHTSELIWHWANALLLEVDKGRTCCWCAESRENQFNAATFELTPEWFNTG